MPASLIIIRHGETDWNAEGRYQGQSDPPLNEEGREQARHLSRSLLDAGIDLIYTSTLKRAVETGEIIAERLNIPLFKDIRLQEVNLGEWEGLLRREIVGKYGEGFIRWEADPWNIPPPGGETLHQVKKRVLSATRDILAHNDGKSLCLVAHLLPLILIKTHFDGIDPSRIWEIPIPNGHWETLILPEKG